ncbi:carbohydrate kinase family protein [Lysobacter korlensis]|uniref:Carbohydrate kinase family protein n=1 Tax=Lysobacter korlensis TaxID=553636 RepID=A0ABV6RUB3_9GAMM
MSDGRTTIVVMGDVIDDILVQPLRPVEPDSDTPATITARPGGSAGNAAAWLGFLGAEVAFVGRVGAADAERHAALFRAAGVEPNLTIDPVLPTGAVVSIVEGQSRTMLTQRGANTGFDPASVTDELLARAAVLHLTGYTLFGAADHAQYRALFARARAHGVAISVDCGAASFLRGDGGRRFLDVVAGTTILFPNLDEGRALTGRGEPADVVRVLLNQFPVAALTLGAAGCLVARAGGEQVPIPAVPTAVVDTTGAGDAFAAGFLAEWVRSGSIGRAGSAGVEAAADCVGIIGGRPAERPLATG